MGIDDLSDVTDQVRHWLDDDAVTLATKKSP